MTEQENFPKLDATQALRHAGLIVGFMWQDEAAQGQSDGVGEVEYATILGTLPEEVNGFPVYLVSVDGIAQSTFGYSYPVEKTVKVSMRQDEQAEDTPLIVMVEEATEDEEVACHQHTRDLTCQEYTRLIQMIESETYTKKTEEGIYWNEDQNISLKIQKMMEWALEQKRHFTLSPEKGKGYILEPATQQEILEYEAAKEAAEQEEDEDEEDENNK